MTTTEKTMQFVQLTEYNDHEGESWSFWLQLDGNEEEIDKLRELLNQAQYEADDRMDFDYELTDNVEPEDIVDKLIEYATEGYMDSHQKITGVFTCPDDLGEDAAKLYKGKIADFFTAAG